MNNCFPVLICGNVSSRPNDRRITPTIALIANVSIIDLVEAFGDIGHFFFKTLGNLLVARILCPIILFSQTGYLFFSEVRLGS